MPLRAGLGTLIRRLVEKSLIDREVRLVLYQELSERIRHYVNLATAISGLYIAVKTIASIAYIDFFAIILNFYCMYKALTLKRLLRRIEELVSRDPAVSLKEKIEAYEDYISYLIIIVTLLILGLII